MTETTLLAVISKSQVTKEKEKKHSV